MKIRAESPLPSPVAHSTDLAGVRSRFRKSRVGVSSQRLLGAFYTPDDLAILLTRWAVNSSAGPVLDPSYGGCAFLRAAVRVLSELQSRRARDLVYGVDIDPKCIPYAANLISPRNYLTADFLSLNQEALPGFPFRAVVGNPPYVRHHWLTKKKRRLARAIAERAGVSLPATASSWAYFVLHALSFLGDEGRLAFLVPEAVLQADYARGIRDALVRRFKSVFLIHIRDRVFANTSEPVVVIAGEGKGPGAIQVASINNPAELGSLLDGTGWKGTRIQRVSANGRVASREVTRIIDELKALPQVRPFAELAKTRIGVVTGGNGFFIRTKEEVKELGIPYSAVVPILAKSHWLKGLELTAEDLERCTDLGRRSLLVRPTDYLRGHTGIRRWVGQGVAQSIHKRHKCEDRRLWFRVDLGFIPDAFATCTRLGAPLLALNRGGIRCTNALHAVSWLGGLADPKSVAVGFLTSLVAVWSELYGRRYGKGVLKLDLGTLRRVPVPICKLPAGTFDELSALIRAGNEGFARQCADDIVLRKGLGVSVADIRRLQLATTQLTKQRVPATREGCNG